MLWYAPQPAHAGPGHARDADGRRPTPRLRARAPTWHASPTLAAFRESLHPTDAETGRSRGFFVASKSVTTSPSVSLLRLTLDKLRWATLATDLCTQTALVTDAMGLVRTVLQTLQQEGGVPVELRNVRAVATERLPSGARAAPRARAGRRLTDAGDHRAQGRFVVGEQPGRDLAGPGLERDVMMEAQRLCDDARAHSLYALVRAAIADVARTWWAASRLCGAWARRRAAQG